MKSFQLVALMPALAIALAGAPALAETQAPAAMPDRAQASEPVAGAHSGLDTTVPALIYGVADNRRAAVAYLNDATRLIDQAEAQLRTANADPRAGRALLVGASGKLVTAYLDNFRDRQFAASLRPLTAQIDRAVGAFARDPLQAASLLDRLRPQLAALTDSQLASLGGGAGGGGGAGAPAHVNAPGFEDLTPPPAIQFVPLDRNRPMQEQNQPMD